MRKLLTAALLMAATFAAAPASADQTTVCSDTAPNVCVSLTQVEGEYSATFVFVSIDGAGVHASILAGSESSEGYRSTGTCASRDLGEFGGLCVVLFEFDGAPTLWIFESETGTCYFATPDAITEC